jgi:hypothetical protein
VSAGTCEDNESRNNKKKRESKEKGGLGVKMKPGSDARERISAQSILHEQPGTPTPTSLGFKP